MKTINYQGQQIPAQRANEMDGDLTIARLDAYEIVHHGHEELLRDLQGRYYLRRELKIIDVDGTFEHPASGRTLVHRLSLTAAVQWATMRANAETHDLRRDVAAALTIVPGFGDLDDNARRLLREHLAENPQHDARDVLNGAMDFLLSNPEEDGPLSVHQATRWARERRKEGTRGKDTGPYMLPLHLSKVQWGMLRQAARHDGKPMDKWVIDILSRNVSSLLADFYDHDDERAEAGWSGDAVKPPRGCTLHLYNADGTLDSTTQLSGAGRLKLEARARANGTDLATEYLATIRKGLLPKLPGEGELATPASLAAHARTLPLPKAIEFLHSHLATENGEDDAYSDLRFLNIDLRAMDEELRQVAAGQELPRVKRWCEHSEATKPGQHGLSLSFELDHFHADLLRAFERRNGIDATTYARAVLGGYLEDIFDHRFNGGSLERGDVKWIRDGGGGSTGLSKEEVADRCEAAGLDPADYPDAGEEEEELAAMPVYTGKQFAEAVRRQAGNPADVALLAAAKPEAAEEDDEEPLPEEEHAADDDEDEAQDGKEGR